MIDLHVHTTYSDGSFDLKKVLEEAEKAKLEVLSITDHDNVLAYEELKSFDYKKIFSGKLIVGGEFNTSFNDLKIEFLGYDFDVDKIDKWCKEKYTYDEYAILMNEFKMIVNKCIENDIKFDYIDYNPLMGWPVEVLLPSIKRYDENKKKFSEEAWNDKAHFFRCMTCDKNFPLYLDFSYLYPKAKEVSDTIRGACGKVFLAHLFLYPMDNYEKFLDDLRCANLIDGVEVNHSKFTKEQVLFLKNYCKKYNLLMSCGSDYHGDKKVGRKIGCGYDNIYEDISLIKNWID